MLLEHERNYGLGMDALVSVCSWNTSGIPTAPRMLLEHERNSHRTSAKTPRIHPPCRVRTTAEYEPCINYYIIGLYRGYIGNIWDNGKENGSYCLGFRRLFTIHLTMNLFERALGQGRSAGMEK